MAMSLAPCAWLFTSLEDLADIDAHDLLAGAAFGEGHVVLEHGLHLVDVVAQRLELGTVLEQSELEAKAGQHGAEVVAHAGQHDGALLDMALDAVAHLDEGVGRLAHLARAARAEVLWRRAPLAEALGRLRQAQDRLDLVAQEEDGDGQAARARCRPSTDRKICEFDA